MDFVLLADDGQDPGAPARREAARPRQVAKIRTNVAAGRLVMSRPRLRTDGVTTGSLQVFRLADQAAMAACPASEPFAQTGIWTGWQALDFRIAPMSWKPQAGRAGGETGPAHGFAITARDGADAEAGQRRLATRPRHFARLAPEVAAGRLGAGGAVPDAPKGRMVGSLIPLALPDEAAVRARLTGEPSVAKGAWQDIRIERWRIGAQPHHLLPGAGGTA